MRFGSGSHTIKPNITCLRSLFFSTSSISVHSRSCFLSSSRRKFYIKANIIWCTPLLISRWNMITISRRMQYTWYKHRYVISREITFSSYCQTGTISGLVKVFWLQLRRNWVHSGPIINIQFRLLNWRNIIFYSGSNMESVDSESIQSDGHENDGLKEPLLAKKGTLVSEYEQDDVKCSGVLVWEEVKKQCWIAGPMVAVSLLQYSLQVISVMLVGHLGELALSSASIATSFASVSGFTVLMGLASALETLCGQAYGAKQYHMLGIHTQRATFALFCVSIPLAVVWAYMGYILTALGQDPLISFEAGKFARWMIPSLFAYTALQPLLKFLQSQSIVVPMMVTSAITLCFHVPICWALVFKTGLGNKGAAFANSISNWFNVALLLLYIKFSPACKKTWTSFTRDALNDIQHFLKLAVPSAVMICLEYWSFEMLVLLSGLLPNPKLEMSVLSICLNTGSLAYMIPFGLGAAVSTRVSNELGAGHSCAARLAVYVGVCMAIMESIMIACLLFSIRNVWGYAYSKEQEVTDYVASMIPLLAASSIMDGIQGTLSGVARGCGWQKLGAYVNLGAYYMVGVPVAVLLAFVLRFGGRGLWLGIICGASVQTILLILITSCTDWAQQERNARERVYTTTLPTVTDNIIKDDQNCRP